MKLKLTAGVGGLVAAAFTAWVWVGQSAMADPEDETIESSTIQSRAATGPPPSGPATQANAAGSTWSMAPTSVPDGSTVTLADLRHAMEDDDPVRAVGLAERFAKTHKGNERDAAWFLAGWVRLERDEPGLAAEAFALVRAGNGALAPWAAWYEAKAELARGRPAVAVARCSNYRTTWPNAAHAEACLQVIARGQAAAGNPALAKEAAATWDAAHPEAAVGEQVKLLSATRRAVKDPEGAIPILQELATTFDAPLTGRVAEQALAQLRQRGFREAILSPDRASRRARAVSLRDAARLDDAWAAFQELRQDASDDPAAAAWVEAQGPTFAYRTHRYDELARLWVAKYDEQPTGDGSWRPIEALCKAGKWADAATRARVALRDYGGTREVRAHTEEIGRVFLFAHAYDDARATFDQLAERGGSTGRRAELLGGFAAYLAGDDADAVHRLDAVVERGRQNEVEARYWRSKSLERAGRESDAEQDRAWIRAKAGMSWYGVLLDPGRGKLRTGRFPVPPPPPTPPPPRYTLVGPIVPGRISHSSSPTPPIDRFARMAWSGLASPPPLASVAAPAVGRSPDHPPPSYLAGRMFDPVSAAQLLKTAARGATFPELAAVRDLTAVGLYDLGGPLLARAYEDWRKASASASDPRHDAAVAIGLDGDDWRQLFLLARDHNHTARQWFGVDRDVADPNDKLEALRLSWPIAHDRFVWRNAREHNVDPYLVLGLMRQESTYDPLARSSVGARGAMQIMPRTGHLIADLEHDTLFTAGDLEDPILSVDYGIRYLGLLMKRFDGSFPLAVASYNGGPHNVGGWLRGAPDVPPDVFVELIPYKETRNYVKQVSANYTTYLALYEPGTAMSLPRSPRADHREVVDF
jgi:soluble lytic murein transglycosylase-like protein